MIGKLPFLSLLCLVICLPQSLLAISSNCYNIKSSVDKINRFILFQLKTERLPLLPQRIGVFSSRFVPNQPCKLKLVIYSKSYYIGFYYFEEALDEFNKVRRIEQIFKQCRQSPMILSRYERSLLRMLFRSSQTLNTKQCRKLQKKFAIKSIAIPDKKADKVQTKLILKRPQFIFFSSFFMVLIAIGLGVLFFQVIVFGKKIKSISSTHSDRADEDSNNEYLIPHFRKFPIFVQMIDQQNEENERNQLPQTDLNRTNYVHDWINDYYLTRNTLKESNSKQRMLIQDRIFHAQKIYL